MVAPVHAVIFDLDGTLFDHRGSATAALRQWLPQLGVEPDESTIDAWFTIEDRHLSAWATGHATFVEQRRRRLREFLDVHGVMPGTADDDLDRLFSTYLAGYTAAWAGFDDVDTTVAAMSAAGLTLAVLTNGSTEQQNAKVAAIGLTGRVGTVFTAEDLGAAKPAPSTYLEVCRRLRVAPDNTLHVGDRYDLDVLAPRAAGLQAVHLDRYGVGPGDEARRIRRLDQLLSAEYLPGWRQGRTGD